MQEDNHIFQGMRRDNHPIKQDGNFLWDAHNIRITNRDDNTLLSITNERGTELITNEDTIQILKGLKYAGHCVVGRYLILFMYDITTSSSSGVKTLINYIIRIDSTDNYSAAYLIYYIEDNFDEEKGPIKGWWGNTPIQAVPLHESDLIQKVYWVDSGHQPRAINVAMPELKGAGKSDDYTNVYNYETVQGAYINDLSQFDFIPDLKLKEEVSINKVFGEGLFAPGVIQYAFTYYNKYGSESNIFYTSPILYISPKDRGGNPEDNVSNTFSIVVDNVDTRFDFIRIYSIHRTTLNSEPTVKVVTDIQILDNSKISYSDNGTTGYTITPTALLYIGGEYIIPDCINYKDNTLFLGNIKYNSRWLELKNKICNYIKTLETPILEDDELLSEEEIVTRSPSNVDGTYYFRPDNLTLNGGFKSGETYRCGIQFQDSLGRWSEPIFLGDTILREKHPTFEGNGNIKSYTRLHVPSTIVELASEYGYIKVRTCVVFPNDTEKSIIAQGILCPTVYYSDYRKVNAPYSMSSWLFRPAYSDRGDLLNKYPVKGSDVEFRHSKPLFHNLDVLKFPSLADSFNLRGTEVMGNGGFYVDENILTFHSPDIEFNDNIANLDLSNCKLKIVGFTTLGATIGDIDIDTSTGTLANDAIGFIRRMVGRPTNYSDNNSFNYPASGLVSGLFFEDGVVDTEVFEAEKDDTKKDKIGTYMVYLWQQEGSLNNDIVRPAEKGTRTSVLDHKVISNLKFYNKFLEVSDTADNIYDITSPVLFNSNELELNKLRSDVINKDVTYYGNVDSAVTSTCKEFISLDSNFNGEIRDLEKAANTGLVRVSYKSTPHVVFSLKKKDGKIELLPRYNNRTWQNNSLEDIPDDFYIEDIEEDEIHATNNFLYYLGINKPSKGVKADRENIGYYAFSTDTGKLYISKEVNRRIEWVEVNKTDLPDLLKLVPHVSIIEGMDNISLNRPIAGSLRSYYGPLKYYTVVESGISGYYTLKEATPQTRESRASDSEVYSQRELGIPDIDVDPYLVVAELIRDNPPTFGGDSEQSLTENLWLPAGEPKSLTNDIEGDYDSVLVDYEYGDTWYSRYDCLKTYPFTDKSTNQLVEIGSFMLETRVNIEGRYDRNIGQLSNLNITPSIFNKINQVYSQLNTFFNYRIYDKGYYKQSIFSNRLMWTDKKLSGDIIDSWSKVISTNSIDLTGDYGAITSIHTHNNGLFCIQEKAFNRINFNDRVQIPVSEGAPIELSSSYKVDGFQRLYNDIGCHDKFSSISTELGIMFIDFINDRIYLYNEDLQDVTKQLGMQWWVKGNHTLDKWKPLNSTSNSIRLFYDSLNKDIYLTPGPGTNKDALCFSSVLGQFTSQMSYGGVPAMVNLRDKFIALDTNSKLWTMFSGEYNKFFGEYKPFDISFITNQNPSVSKIFDTIEVRADNLFRDNTAIGDKYTTKIQDSQPFEYIQVDNEYQDTGMVEFNPSTLRKKFRIWRGIIPRDRSGNSRSRIMNPWSRIKLGVKSKDKLVDTKFVLHDLSVKYTM